MNFLCRFIWILCVDLFEFCRVDLFQFCVFLINIHLYKIGHRAAATVRVYYTILSAKNLPIFDPIKPFCQRNPTFNFSLSQCKLGFYYSNAFITPKTYKYTHRNVKTKKWMYLPFVIKNSVRSFKCKLLYYNEFDIWRVEILRPKMIYSDLDKF